MDDYLNHGRPSPQIDLLTRDIRSSAANPALSRPVRKDDLYLSGYGRQWGEGLTYSAGVAYASGIALGGSYGFLLGLRKGGATRRLFMNAILNSCATHGPVLANKCAVITMFYCGFHSLFGLIKESESPLNAALAGGVSGGLFKLAGSWRARATYSLSAAASSKKTQMLFLCVVYPFKSSHVPYLIFPDSTHRRTQQFSPSTPPSSTKSQSIK